MALYNAADIVKAHAPVVVGVLAGEKRIVDLPLDLRRDAAAVVPDLQDSPQTLLPDQKLHPGLPAHLESGLTAVGEKVVYRFAKGARVGQKEAVGTQLLEDRNLRVLAVEALHRPGGHLRKTDRGQRKGAVLHRPVQFVHPGEHPLVQVPEGLGAGPELLEVRFLRFQDPGQLFMQHPAGEKLVFDAVDKDRDPCSGGIKLPLKGDLLPVLGVVHLGVTNHAIAAKAHKQKGASP